MYVDDNSHYPGGGLGYYTVGGLLEPTNAWSVQLAPYTGQFWSNALYQCPGYHRPGGINPQIVIRGNIGYNVSGARSSTESLGLWNAAESRIKMPSDMIALGDDIDAINGTDIVLSVVAMGWIRLNVPANDGAVLPLLRSFPRNYAAYLHGGRLSTAFCDGHVELINYKKLYLDTSDAGRRRWNTDNEPHHELWLASP
jgi:prepilin-type processing-associated H-X9-DG protein